MLATVPRAFADKMAHELPQLGLVDDTKESGRAQGTINVLMQRDTPVFYY
jgi:hypothetical protein